MRYSQWRVGSWLASGPCPPSAPAPAGARRSEAGDAALSLAFAPVSGGFRFVLMLENGEPADPAAFLTAIPTWRVGDEFLAGSDLRKFRILHIEPELSEEASREFQAVWTVAAVA